MVIWDTDTDTGGVALRDVRVSVPAAIQRGTAAVLRCRYDLEGDALYSVKWYKGRREFFRYTPRENPAIKVFPFAGLTVDKSRSNATQITLPRVDVGLSGRYSCEVSADAPSFHTHLVSGDMAVVEVPDDVPSISGVKPRYRTGDTLNATCSSTWSRPAATLLWIVNEEPAQEQQLRPYPAEVEPGGGGRERARLGLVLPLEAAGRYRVRCVARLDPVYFKSAETSLAPPPPTRLSWGLLDDEYPHSEYTRQPTPQALHAQ
ncbi:uncharacterized protein LOC126203535 [Schistocerca nitens]|uniref:uncharacterized protein LOC126203535 n=1 Tax=Schistocerca nitens TaxID=7011 RepID=UPI0021199AFB|nr:uncharacterized protein LOC126203535 [Schistocerca nitens]